MPRLDPFESAGTLGIEEGELSISVLGRQLDVCRRPVVLDEKPSSLEYRFSTTLDDKRLDLGCLYLSEDGELCVDPSCQDELINMHNQSAGGVILRYVASLMLDSALFAPTAVANPVP